MNMSMRYENLQAGGGIEDIVSELLPISFLDGILESTNNRRGSTTNNNKVARAADNWKLTARKMDRPGSTTNNNNEVVKALVDSNTQMGKDMEFLKNRLNALEMM